MGSIFLKRVWFLWLPFIGVSSSIYGAANLHLVDPTKPYEWTDVAPVETASTSDKDSTLIVPQALSLDSVLYAPDRRVAVINGQMVREGGVVDKAKVVKILRQAVIVKKEGVTTTLTLQKFGEDQDFKLIRR